MASTGLSTLQEYCPVSSINTADTHRLTRSSAYTSAMFSETRYALNGDLRVAYRASREGARDIVVVPNWFTLLRDFAELPAIQGWVEAMTSLGRLIVFDQPGTGVSDPVSTGALPTLEQRTDSITAVLRRSRESRSGSRRARTLVPARGAVRGQHIRLAPPRWSGLRAMRIRWLSAPMGSTPEKFSRCHGRRVGNGGASHMCAIPTCRGTRKSGQRGRDMNAWRRAHGPLLS